MMQLSGPSDGGISNWELLNSSFRDLCFQFPKVGKGLNAEVCELISDAFTYCLRDAIWA